MRLSLYVPVIVAFAGSLAARRRKRRSRVELRHGRRIEIFRGSRQPTLSTCGTLLGGVAGGIIGHQIGSGRGNTAATIAGAMAALVVVSTCRSRKSGCRVPVPDTVGLDSGSTLSRGGPARPNLRVGDRVRSTAIAFIAYSAVCEVYLHGTENDYASVADLPGRRCARDWMSKLPPGYELHLWTRKAIRHSRRCWPKWWAPACLSGGRDFVTPIRQMVRRARFVMGDVHEHRLRRAHDRLQHLAGGRSVCLRSVVLAFGNPRPPRHDSGHGRARCSARDDRATRRTCATWSCGGLRASNSNPINGCGNSSATL